MKGKRVFVTGADGFIGSHLAERLIKLGADVTALALHTAADSYGWLDDIDVQKVRGDIRDAAFIRRAISGHDIVFHLAALGGIPHSYDCPEAYIDTNVRGTLNVLEAARDCGRIIHTSTSEVYGSAQRTPQTEDHPLNPQSPYAASKVGADALARAYCLSFALNVVTLRPFNTFGPRQSQRAVIPAIIRQALAGPTIKVGDTTPKRDFMFFDDTVAAFIATARHGKTGEVYNAGRGVPTSIAALLDLVISILGPRALVTDGDRIRPPNSEVRELVADHSKLTRHTGWSPAISLREGLLQTIDWWRQRPKGPCVIA